MSWVGPASKWFEDLGRWDVFLAEDGPDDWHRVAVGRPPGRRRPSASQQTRSGRCYRRHSTDLGGDPAALEVDRVRTSTSGRDGISFDVDQIGVPVLVKMSYFPNWHASGADGPYRVTPNLMVRRPDRHPRRR